MFLPALGPLTIKLVNENTSSSRQLGELILLALLHPTFIILIPGQSTMTVIILKTKAALPIIGTTNFRTYERFAQTSVSFMLSNESGCFSG